MDNLMLINKKNGISKEFIPDSLVICDDNKNNFHRYIDKKLKPMIQKDVYYQFQLLHNTALEDGFDIIIDSGYRSYNYQNILWEMEFRDNYKALKTKYPFMEPSERYFLAQHYTDRLVARPGYSEHHTGLAFDFAIMNKEEYSSDVVGTLESMWMKENAHKFGFILRYPSGKEKITGYNCEEWHYRYVGFPYSKEMHDNDLTLEEYHELVLKK